jgi:magnesium chelatase family protein
MLAKRLPGVLPPLREEEALEVSAIHSVAGTLPAGVGLLQGRPFRSPHHSASDAGILGGGYPPRPGELSLAHHGVLFLDELPEFRRDVLESLRQPLEDGLVTVGRAQQTITMPAQFLLVAAMNPCPCGYRGHRQRPCLCTPAAIARYRTRLSGPLLDRLDLQVEVPALTAAELRATEDPAGSTAQLRERVLLAHGRQQHRQQQNGITAPNARLLDRALQRACQCDELALLAVDEVLRQHHQSARGRVRLLRLARTLADLDDHDTVRDIDVLQAAALRGFHTNGLR